ncbi:hypothetical protein ACHAQA_007793 [Verticillium albo-atrum]
MSKRRNLDGVASLQGFLAKASNEQETTPRAQSKAQTKKKAAFDPRADDSDSESEGSAASSDSDSDGAAPDPSSWNRLNKSASTPTSQKGIAPSKRTPRSNGDEVADSDDGRGSKKSKSKKKTTKKAVSSDESSTSSASSDSESEAEPPAKKAVKKTAAKKEVTKKKADTSSSDSSTSGGSGSESDSDDDAGSKKAAKSLMNGKKAPSKEASSTSSSSASSTTTSSESEAEAPAKKDKKAATKKAAAKTKKTATKEATPEESSESEEESREEESTSAVETEKEPEKTAEPLAVAPPPKVSTTGFQSENFLLRPVQGDEDGKDVQQFFAQAKRDGKQLWYFTAPASVPINVIEQLEIPIHKIRNGEPVFKHDGADYGVNVSNEAANPTYQVLIPNKKGVRYEPVAQNVEQVMRIKRIIQVPSPAEGEVTPLPLASSRGPRPQPKGLKARYHPIGVSADEDMGKLGSDSDGEGEDVEMTQAPALPSSQKASKKATSSAKKTKRKAAEVEEEAVSSQLIREEESALKKKTKKQKRSAEDAPAAASQELQTLTLPVLPAPKTGKGAKKVSFPAPASSQTSKKETPILPPQVPHRASSGGAATPVPSAKKEKKSKSATPKAKSKQARPLSP